MVYQAFLPCENCNFLKISVSISLKRLENKETKLNIEA